MTTTAYRNVLLRALLDVRNCRRIDDLRSNVGYAHGIIGGAFLLQQISDTAHDALYTLMCNARECRRAELSQ